MIRLTPVSTFPAIALPIMAAPVPALSGKAATAFTNDIGMTFIRRLNSPDANQRHRLPAETGATRVRTAARQAGAETNPITRYSPWGSACGPR